MVPLYSCGSIWLFDLPIFLEGDTKWSGEREGDFCVTWSWGSILNLFSVSILLLGCLVYSAATGWQCSCGIILAPWFPSDTRKYKVSGGPDSWLRVMSLGAAYLPPGIDTPLQIKSRGEIFPSLWQDLFLWPYFLVFCRGGEVKIDVNGKIEFRPYCSGFQVEPITPW